MQVKTKSVKRSGGRVTLPEGLQGRHAVDRGQVVEPPGDGLEVGEEEEGHQRRHVPGIADGQHLDHAVDVDEVDGLVEAKQVAEAVTTPVWPLAR